MTVPNERDYIHFLIKNYLKANGIAKAAEIGYLLKGTKSSIEQVIGEMVETKELIPINVEGDSYTALSTSLSLLSSPLLRKKLKILSPFDNLLIQRKRTKSLFNFDYQIECYLPESKRQFGYFLLPLLWDGRLVARMDCKAERKSGTLWINNLSLESGHTLTEGFVDSLKSELHLFCDFNGCRAIEANKGVPPLLCSR